MKTSTVKLIHTTAEKHARICDESFTTNGAVAAMKASLTEFLAEAMENEAVVHAPASKTIEAADAE